MRNSAVSIQVTKKIFARATSQECAKSTAKIAPTASHSDAVRRRTSCTPAPGKDLGAKHAAAASTTAAAQRSTACAVVRGRSLVSPLAAAHPDTLARAILLVCRCTPARWMAGKLDRQCPLGFGSGEVVAAATVLQPSCNRETLTFQCVVAPVARLQLGASRHAHARTCGQPRAHMRGLISATLQPSHITYVDQWVSRCRTVAGRLRLQPSLAPSSQTRRNPPFPNKIGGGYWVGVDPSAMTCRIRGRAEGRVGKSFGLGARATAGLGAPIGRIRQASPARGRNGGNAWVSGVTIGPVGTAMLEQTAQTRINASFVEPRRQLFRLTGRAVAVDLGAEGRGGLGPAGRGVAPPSAARRSLGPLADAIFFKTVGLRPDQSDCRSAGRKKRGTFGSSAGSGDGPFRPALERAAGLGRDAGWGLCRSRESSGGWAHVN